MNTAPLQKDPRRDPNLGNYPFGALGVQGLAKIGGAPCVSGFPFSGFRGRAL